MPPMKTKAKGRAANRKLAGGLRHAQWLGFDPGLEGLRLGNLAAPAQLRNLAGAALVVTAVAIYALWPRCRYFGNTAPLVVAAGLGALALLAPMPSKFLFTALPFAFVFIGGIVADLLETKRRKLALAAVVVVLAAHAALSLRLLLSA